MAWSQIVCLESHCNCSLLKTLLCLEYSWGICDGSISWCVPIVALHSRSWLVFSGCGLLMVHGMNRAFVASGALNIIGSCVWSIHPCFQSILGCTAMNHGYPKIALCPPRCVRKNLMFVAFGLVHVARSV